MTYIDLLVICGRVLFLFSMPANFAQYRWAVDRFNNPFPANKKQSSFLFRTSTLRSVWPKADHFVPNCFIFISMIVLTITSLVRSKNKYMRTSMKSTVFRLMFLFCVHFKWICNSIIYLSEDVERNPEPSPNFTQNITIGHWNLNSMI